MADKHYSDQELLLAVDGELTPQQQEALREHLLACWTCRERMTSLEDTISSYVRARNEALAAQVPPHSGPRARFRARLTEVAEPLPQRSHLPRLVAATVTFVLVAGAGLAVFQASVNAEGPKPRQGLTPGETRDVTRENVCSSQQASKAPAIAESVQRQVFAAYGINPARRNEFEIDYLVTPDLGGADSVRNLWPQPYSAKWNAHVKDQLEQRLHSMVCEGKLDLATAQHDIAVDWIGAYKRYVGTR